jgi:hypothetical protein
VLAQGHVCTSRSWGRATSFNAWCWTRDVGSRFSAVSGVTVAVHLILGLLEVALCRGWEDPWGGEDFRINLLANQSPNFGNTTLGSANVPQLSSFVLPPISFLGPHPHQIPKIHKLMGWLMVRRMPSVVKRPLPITTCPAIKFGSRSLMNWLGDAPNLMFVTVLALRIKGGLVLPNNPRRETIIQMWSISQSRPSSSYGVKQERV